MKTAEDFYMLWIESDEATKYRNSPKYRYSEMIAFAEAYSEHQNKELIKKLKHHKDTTCGLYANDRPDGLDDSDWWCPNCKVVVSPNDVTNDERHGIENCMSKVN